MNSKHRNRLPLLAGLTAVVMMLVSCGETKEPGSKTSLFAVGEAKAGPIATQALKELTFEFDAGAAALALGQLGVLREAPSIRKRLGRSKLQFVPHGIEALG